MAFQPSRIEAVVFDAYGTLFDPSSIGQHLSQLLPERSAALLHTWREKQLQYTWLRSLMGQYRDFYALTEEALHYALLAHDCTLPEAAIGQLMKAYYTLSAYEEVKPALQKLSAHYKLAILSNANPSLLERATENTGTASYFRQLLSADAVRRYKPDPQVYALATQGLGVSQAQLLFVSSNTWDIAGAAAAGLSTAWVNRQDAVPEQLGFSADLVLNSLSALPGALAV